MKTTEDIRIIFRSLSGYQQEQVLEELLQEHELQGALITTAIEEVVKERGKKPCPHCCSTKVYERGKQKGVQMYQCREDSCKKWYSVTTGTPLWDIKLKSKWQSYLR